MFYSLDFGKTSSTGGQSFYCYTTYVQINLKKSYGKLLWQESVVYCFKFEVKKNDEMILCKLPFTSSTSVNWNSASYISSYICANVTFAHVSCFMKRDAPKFQYCSFCSFIVQQYSKQCIGSLGHP